MSVCWCVCMDRAFSCVLRVSVGNTACLFALLASLAFWCASIYPSTNERRGSLAVPQAATTPPTKHTYTCLRVVLQGFNLQPLAAAVDMSSVRASDNLIGVHTYYTPHNTHVGPQCASGACSL